MNLITPISGMLLWLSMAIGGACVLLALVRAPWHQLAARSIRQHLWFGAILCLGVFWPLLSVNVQDSFRLHPMLIASATFIFGLELTLVLGAAALIITHAIGGITFANLGLNFMIGVVTPALVITGILWFIGRLRIKNLFVYTLGGGFIGGMLSMLSVALVSLVLFTLAEEPLASIGHEHSYLFLLLTFPEGFCNGAIISTLAVLTPDLVKTYNDDFYLSRD